MGRIRCVQITRGLAPALSIASTVSACARRKIDYKLIVGVPAAEAKQQAAQTAFEAGQDLLLVEDDILANDEIWNKVTQNDSDVMLGSCLMKNGELNVWFHGPRVVYSGTVFLKVPWAVLGKIGDPWFLPRDLGFTSDDGGVWWDKGPNDEGKHSDTWFYYRCWQENIHPIVAGFVLHGLHAFNNKDCDLVNATFVKWLGVMTCSKVTI